MCLIDRVFLRYLKFVPAANVRDFHGTVETLNISRRPGRANDRDVELAVGLVNQQFFRFSQNVKITYDG